MTGLKKNFLAAVLSSTLLLTGTQVFAQSHEMPTNMPMHMMHMTQEQIAENASGWAKHFSEAYGVDKAQVEAALKRGVHIRDVQFASMLAKLSGKSFDDVLAMKVDWQQVTEKLGVTREQIDELQRQQMDDMLALNSGVDVNTVKSLLKDGYAPQDIMIAGKIAKAAGKDVKSVLGKRKINNTWDDVAKSFGVDIRNIMPKPPRHGQRHQ